MSMLPKTETPAAEGGAEGKAGSAAGTSAQPRPAEGAPASGGATSPSGQDGRAPITPTTGAGSGTSNGSPSAGGTTPTAPADPKADFERKLASLADLEMTVAQRAKAIEQLEAKYRAFEGLGAALPEGITADALAGALASLKEGKKGAFMKAVFRDAWTQQMLIDLADEFDAEELSVEERVERKLAAERKKAEEDAEAKRLADAQAEDARKKKADEDAIADAGRQLSEAKASAGKWLAANIAKYPLIAALDDDEDVDHEQMFTDRLIGYVEKHGKMPTDEEGLAAMRTEIFDKIEARHRRQAERLNPKPKNMREEMSEWDRIELSRLKRDEATRAVPIAQVKAGPKTGLEEALERMARQDAEDRERERLAYGRR